jgi:hypothetical protein
LPVEFDPAQFYVRTLVGAGFEGGLLAVEGGDVRTPLTQRGEQGEHDPDSFLK